MTEMVYPLYAHNIVLSVVGGLAIGGVLAWRLHFPRGWIGFGIILGIALLSPWVGFHTVLVKIGREWAIHWNVFCVSLFAAFAVRFICRLLNKPQSAGHTNAGESC